MKKKNPPPEQTTLSSEDLSLRWNLTPQTLAQWRWNGKGPQFIKMGSRVVYRLKDVEQFEEQKIRTNTAQKERDWNSPLPH